MASAFLPEVHVETDVDVQLLQTTFSVETTPTSVLTAGRMTKESSGWYASAKGESCDDSCASRGLACSNSSSDIAEVDTSDEVKDLIYQVGGDPGLDTCKTGCNFEPGSWKDGGPCWYCANPSTHDCSSSNTKRHLLCYCESATTTTTTVPTITAVAATDECYSSAVPGRSPGSSLGGKKAAATLSDCQGLCTAISSCLAIIYRESSELCYTLERTYDANYAEATDDCVVANKLSCQASDDCYSRAVSGRSPGSSIGGPQAASTLSDCEGLCTANSACKAIIFRESSEKCYTLARTYDANYGEATDDCVVSNKESC